LALAFLLLVFARNQNGIIEKEDFPLAWKYENSHRLVFLFFEGWLALDLNQGKQGLVGWN
tara:strand:- start:330 stop:509 length:180 start_codon:yes stop_codon:yes gene_type:complete